MNVLDGQISSFSEFESISRVSVATKCGEFSVLMLDFSASLKIGSKVQILFKENELFLAKKGSNIICENVFESKILHIKNGEILSEISLENGLKALLSSQICDKFNLRENEEILAFIKDSAIIIKLI